jgi:hypothetical protein
MKSGTDIWAGWVIKGWKSIPCERRRRLLDRARYQVYKPGSRETKVLVAGACLAFIFSFCVFALAPLLLTANAVYGIIGVVPAVAFFQLASGMLYVYLLRDRLTQFIDSC